MLLRGSRFGNMRRWGEENQTLQRENNCTMEHGKQCVEGIERYDTVRCRDQDCVRISILMKEREIPVNVLGRARARAFVCVSERYVYGEWPRDAHF